MSGDEEFDEDKAYSDMMRLNLFDEYPEMSRKHNNRPVFLWGKNFHPEVGLEELQMSQRIDAKREAQLNNSRRETYEKMLRRRYELGQARDVFNHHLSLPHNDMGVVVAGNNLRTGMSRLAKSQRELKATDDKLSFYKK